MSGEGVSVTGVAAAAAASTLPLRNVFVYGSLLADEVVQVVLKRVPPSSPAVLHHHRRFSIKGRVYPAILPVENKKVTGKVLLGITDRELDVLDTFEDVEYERRAVEVSLAQVQTDAVNLQCCSKHSSQTSLLIKCYIPFSGPLAQSQIHILVMTFLDLSHNDHAIGPFWSTSIFDVTSPSPLMHALLIIFFLAV
ncbi:uncharacterized protein [Elaeis guineensis]|uniref:uncharacterized protein isoform X1 n=1 Tax=Elaeis guineensis var. tenera TaxID=51953 RepID=UPI003C6D7258